MQVRPPNILKLGRRCDAAVVQKWLSEKSFRETVTEEKAGQQREGRRRDGLHRPAQRRAGHNFHCRPAGELRVATIALDPNYTFDPAVFPESPEARAVGRK